MRTVIVASAFLCALVLAFSAMADETVTETAGGPRSHRSLLHSARALSLRHGQHIEATLADIGQNPVTYWSSSLRIGDVCKDPHRPPSGKDLVYIVSRGSDCNRDVLYVGAGHATENTDGRARVGTLIGLCWASAFGTRAASA
jgi:hypothetical protein